MSTETTAPVERGILMSGAMVRATLDDVTPKTQTRRTRGLDGVNAEPDRWRVVQYREILGRFAADFGRDDGWSAAFFCPYGRPGDRLWVRETWAAVPATAFRGSEGVVQTVNPADPDMAAVYRAGWDRSDRYWKPSIHMPRWASRIDLEITDLRVERVQQITEADARAEGVRIPAQTVTMHTHMYRDGFRTIWEEINGRESWAANPWVWVISFRRVRP